MTYHQYNDATVSRVAGAIVGAGYNPATAHDIARAALSVVIVQPSAAGDDLSRVIAAIEATDEIAQIDAVLAVSAPPSPADKTGDAS